MGEFIAMGAGIAILLWAFSGKGENPEYTVRETADNRYCEVQKRTGEVMFIGTREQCEAWIENHG